MAWWLGVVIVASVSLSLSAADQDTLRSTWGWVEAVGSSAWLAFPFVAFSGGIAVVAFDRVRAVRALLSTTVGMGLVAYSFGAFLVPEAERRADATAGYDIQARYPYGANTPRAILARRAEILGSLSTEFGFSVEDPMRRPPNWLLYIVHQPVALGLFGIVNALLGLLAGWWTTGLSPPKRRNSRWGLGLGSALVFYLLSTGGAAWVRSDPTHSALLGAWLPLVPPLFILLCGPWVARRADLHGSAPLDV